MSTGRPRSRSWRRRWTAGAAAGRPPEAPLSRSPPCERRRRRRTRCVRARAPRGCRRTAPASPSRRSRPAWRRPRRAPRRAGSSSECWLPRWPRYWRPMGISDEQKIERIKRLMSMMNAADFDSTVELAHPDIVLVRAGGAGELRGSDQLREWMEPDAFESQVNDLMEFEAHDDRVLARIRSRARGAGSGIEIDIVAWTVYRFDDEGLITRVEIFLEHEEDQAPRPLSGRVLQEVGTVDLGFRDPQIAEVVPPAANRCRTALRRSCGELGRAGDHLEALETSRDHGHADLLVHRRVDDGSEDDVGVGVGCLNREARGLVDLEQAEILAAGDIEQHALRAVDLLLDQRRGDCGLGHLHGAVLAGAGPHAHQRGAGLVHDEADIREVEVDQPGDRDQIGDPLDALTQDVVGLAERLEDRGPPLDDLQKLLVGDRDQGVDLLAQAVNALLCLGHPLATLELEGLGDGADSEGADLLFGDLGDHWSGACTRAAALAAGDEDHVRALERVLDLVTRLGGRARADLGVGARAEPLRQV